MYCVECGKDTEKTYESLCKECYLMKNKFVNVPEKIDLIVCSSCMSVYLKKWVTLELGDAIKSIVQLNSKVLSSVQQWEVRIRYKEEDTPTISAEIQIDLTTYGLPVTEYHKTKIHIRKQLCQRCSRIHGKYYVAVIQVRGTERKLSPSEISTAKTIVNSYLEKRKEVFVTKEELKHGGIDFYISDIPSARCIAKSISNEFSGTVTESAKLVSRKDGKNLYRVTFAVRTHKFCVGDLVSFENSVYRVERCCKKTIGALKLENNEFVTIPAEKFSEMKIIDSMMVKECVVVFENSKELQILDPINYNILIVPKPSNFKVKHDTVKVLEYNEKVYLVV